MAERHWSTSAARRGRSTSVAAVRLAYAHRGGGEEAPVVDECAKALVVAGLALPDVRPTPAGTGGGEAVPFISAIRCWWSTPVTARRLAYARRDGPWRSHFRDECRQALVNAGHRRTAHVPHPGRRWRDRSRRAAPPGARGRRRSSPDTWSTPAGTGPWRSHFGDHCHPELVVHAGLRPTPLTVVDHCHPTPVVDAGLRPTPVTVGRITYLVRARQRRRRCAARHRGSGLRRRGRPACDDGLRGRAASGRTGGPRRAGASRSGTSSAARTDCLALASALGGKEAMRWARSDT